MQKAVSYCRVSSSQQARNGISLDAQQSRIKAMAIVQNVELVEAIVDAGESAKDLNRPGMQRLIHLVERKKIKSVIVFKLDRLTRSVKNLAELLELFDKNGVSLISVEESLDTGSAAGRLVLNVMAAVSQWEREAVGERTSMALQYKKQKGESTGNVPYGYHLADNGVHIEKDSEEQRLLHLMKRLRKKGLSFQKIADHLNEKGYRTRNGNLWHWSYIRGHIQTKK